MLYISAAFTLLLIILYGQFKKSIFSFIQFVKLNKLRFIAKKQKKRGQMINIVRKRWVFLVL